MSAQTQDRLAPFHAAKSEAEAKTEKLMVSIDRAAKAIQSMMEQLHGSKCVVQTCHDVGFILIRERSEPKTSIAKPKRGEAA